MKIGSLFSGIGGLELGLEAAGVGEVLWQVELDSFARRVLAKHWPHVDRSVEDVRHAGSATLARVDVVCGGFPCQDVSSAGKGAGLAGARSGLWFEFRRIIAELRPRAVVVENVASGASRWLCQVRTDLHALGYRTRALGIAACDVGAPHRRRRIFILALADADGAKRKRSERDRSAARRRVRAGSADGGALAHGDRIRLRSERLGRLSHEGQPEDGQDPVCGHDPHGRGGSHVPYAQRVELREQQGGGGRAHRPGSAEPGDDRSVDGGASAEPRVGGDAHGFPHRLDRRWPAGRGEEQQAWEPPRSIPSRPTDPTRRPRLKCLGNGVVPAQAERAGVELLAWMRQAAA